MRVVLGSPSNRSAISRTGRGALVRATLGAAIAVAGWTVVTGTSLGRPAGAAAPRATSPALRVTFAWSTTALPDAGTPVAQSSPTVANLPGGPAVVVGDRKGMVYAFSLRTGAPVPGWPASADAPVDSTPSVAVLPGGTDDSVFVGTGNAAHPFSGGYEGFGPNGAHLWSVPVDNPTTDPYPHNGVQASLAVADLGGPGLDVVAGSLGQEEYAVAAAGGAVQPGWPFFTSDSTFSTAAVGDLYGTGRTEIVEGGDQTAGAGRGQTYTQGGHLRIFNPRGGVICDHSTTQTMDSSPAIGAILPGGATGIVTGTGAYWPDAPETGAVMAFTTDCAVAWSTTLDGLTTSSPALADVTGTGSLRVVEGTDNQHGGGSVWVLTGANGTPLWHAAATGEIIGSVTTADLTGDGGQDLLVPTTGGVDIFDGRTHQEVAVLNGSGSTHGVLGFQNSPLVTDTGGTVGITVAGYGCPTSACFGQVEHYTIPGSNGALAVGAGAWPEFHHDPQLSGNAGVDPAPLPPCTVPAAARPGYALVASDGGIFSFGSTPFCGSTGSQHLNAPIVGMAMAPDTGGYWLAAADGGVFAFGGARFFGSMGGEKLNAPIVGFAATPTGGGYWEVAADGGVFAFGDARFFGSMGGTPLNQPVVGIAATADGRGYRLVAADGGVFAFGDAQFFGSMGGHPLNAPVVGLEVDVNTGGYWEVASDGGVFAFQAPFFGSMGGKPLNEPIVGMAATENGYGYRFVASDGGVFAFGTATFTGSMGGQLLNRPVVGMAAP
ncbi:MAG: PQQ-binding-like beta-propeller repeat protein [Acidimicrobiales bacterium]